MNKVTSLSVVSINRKYQDGGLEPNIGMQKLDLL